MRLRIERDSDVPVCRQMKGQIKYQISAGMLEREEQLPSVRALAEELGVNQNTVLKVYTELAEEGILEVVQGSGTYVAGANLQMRKRQRMAIVRRLAGETLAKGLQLGFNYGQIKGFLQDEYIKRQSEELRRQA